MTWPIALGIILGSGLVGHVAYRIGYRDGRHHGDRLGLEHGDAGYTIARRHGDHAHIVWRPTRHAPRAPEDR